VVVCGAGHTLKSVGVPVAGGVAGNTVLVLVKIGRSSRADTSEVNFIGNETSTTSDTGESMRVPEGWGIACYAHAIGIHMIKIGGAKALLFLLAVDSVVRTSEALFGSCVPVVRAGTGNAAVVGSNILGIGWTDT